MSKRRETCCTCGSPVKIWNSREGTSSYGPIDEVQELREKLALAEKHFRIIQAKAGHPDASQACRNVIQEASYAIQEIKGEASVSVEQSLASRV